MRKDIYERMVLMKDDKVKPNYAEIARVYGCDYRTAKKFFEGNATTIVRKPPGPSLLDDFKEIIKTKLKELCNMTSIYKFIEKKGYQGHYTILREYCRSVRVEETMKATIRFESNPGLQAQVDWKEAMTLVSKSGEIFTINIFLTLLGYSRLKYLELTLDRNQDTLMQALINSFKYFAGIPHEILFDNMKTVIDRSRTNYNEAIVNETFYEFSKDMGFQVIPCRAFRLQTKGKVEALAKLMERLRPYNHEFDTLDELDEIVRQLNEELNDDVSLATEEVPKIRYKKEKEYLRSLPNPELLNNYLTKPITRIVSKEAMIVYNNRKYSVPIKYIGKTLTIEVKADTLQIYFKEMLLASHKISNKKFNYQKGYMVEILHSTFRFKKDDEIDSIAERNLKLYDNL